MSKNKEKQFNEMLANKLANIMYCAMHEANDNTMFAAMLLEGALRLVEDWQKSKDIQDSNETNLESPDVRIRQAGGE